MAQQSCCYFRRRAGGFLCVTQANLEDFVGDAIATSTNRRLEGAHRRNWWGFAGRRSADAALHARAGAELLRLCHERASELRFGEAADFVEAPEAAELLRRSYAELLRTAAELGVQSLACPAIGCGCRGYPVREAAEVALRAVGEDAAVQLTWSCASGTRRHSPLHLRGILSVPRIVVFFCVRRGADEDSVWIRRGLDVGSTWTRRST
ncbi:unnamed protein product [Prorocentrum cordatum]|uniref:Macro domain-containing protein n=1 Tax=Prorocentrum cordatum TaxID=2364126 RepID=A0ABN9XK00_9DINO|nr:unnamed protein product [Polarella glacialis]